MILADKITEERKKMFWFGEGVCRFLRLAD